MLQSVTEYYRVVQSATECYRVLQHVTACYRVLQSVTECYRVLGSVTECYRVLLAQLLGPIFGLVFFLSSEFLNVFKATNYCSMVFFCYGNNNKNDLPMKCSAANA